MAESDDEMPQLSGDTLAILKEFYAERDVQGQRYEDLKTAAGDVHEKLSIDMFAEDWNASQFWHTDETSSTLAKQLLGEAKVESGIAVISTPSTFVQLRNLTVGMQDAERPLLKLFEFDNRFSVLEEFVRYDFNFPFTLPPDLKGKFDRVIVDPPFLSEDCQTKMAMTARWLLDPAAVKEGRARIVICTGERMRDLIYKAYPGCKATDFELVHNKGRLSNEFICYANFENKEWKWIDG